MLDRKEAPAFQKISSVKLAVPEKINLDNLLPLFIFNVGKQPLLKLEVIVKAGSWYEQKPGTSLLTAKLLKEGTKNHSSKEITYFFDKYGAFLEITPGLDFVVISLYSLSKHFAVLLPVLKAILLSPSFPEDELRIVKSNKIQSIKINQEKPNVVAAQKFREALFGSAHPYGKTITEEDLEAIQAKDLHQYYGENYPSGWEFILSGEVREEDIGQVNLHFGQHEVSPDKSIVVNASDEVKMALLVEKEKSVQSSLRIGKTFLAKDHPDFHKMQVVNEIFGGYFGSRLMKNIREEKGFTYGIQSHVVTLKNAAYWVIGTDVKKENTKETIQEIHYEIQQLQENLVPEEELEVVKNYMIGSFLGEINTPFALSDKFKMIYLHGLDYDYYQDYINAINNITTEDVMMLAQRHLQIDTLTEIVVGGKA